MTVLPAAGRAAPTSPDERWLARRRLARAGWLYAFMLLMSLFFLGPFLMGVLSSFKDNPNEYPPRLLIPQLSARYIGAAYNLGVQGGGGGCTLAARSPLTCRCARPRARRPHRPP